MPFSIDNPILKPLLERIASVASLIHSYGWAEANAGNISIDVSRLFALGEEKDKRLYLVSKTGSRYRQTAKNPKDNFLLIESYKDTDHFHPSDARPTSEWISHRCLQRMRDEYKVILHTHPAEIIALAQIPHFSQKADKLNELLPRILPEMPIYLPEGVAIAPLCPPGSKELCDASLNALTNQKALIWEGHGLLTFANDLDEALDYMEIVVKACKVLFLLPSSHFSSLF